MSFRRVWLACLCACGSNSSVTPDAATVIDSPTAVDAPAMSSLGTVTNVMDLSACPAGAPANATCKQITVSGCPGIETESITATIAILAPPATAIGTVVHLSGGGGRGFQGAGTANYRAAGFRNVLVAWTTDWEQTQTSGIKAAACRPSTVLKWIFDEPTLHAGSRTTAFCGEGFSGGSGQLGYALAQYGMGDYLDYVNELSGPPFGRIDLGCDGSAPATASVCGATVTMRLPPALLDPWENIKTPLTCGSTGVPAAELDRWKTDSISIGGVYAYPKTMVQFYDCTNGATAVTAMAQIYETQIEQAEAGTSLVGYHCYSQADGCQGEALGTGAMDATTAMIAGCTPRH
jgi:hypothetical protein